MALDINTKENYKDLRDSKSETKDALDMSNKKLLLEFELEPKQKGKKKLLFV